MEFLYDNYINIQLLLDYNKNSMKKQVLIIGGPHFIGRNLLSLLSNCEVNLEITLFNRGKTNADLFPQFQRIIGDRNTDDINQLATTKWDYIIDLACYMPHSLENILQHINQDIKKYIFISTVSVYPELDNSEFDETTPLLECTPEEATDVDIMKTYGKKKAACERLLIQSKIPYTILRPGLIFGPYDHTDRFYYWMYQTYKREELFIPELGDKKVGFTYVVDLAKIIIDLIENINTKDAIYNSITHEFTISDVVKNTAKSLSKNMLIKSAPLSFLQNEKIQYWSDLPMWLEANATWSNKKCATDFGHLFTETSIAFQETIAYYSSVNWPTIKLSGIKDDKYQELLDRLKKIAGNI